MTNKNSIVNFRKDVNKDEFEEKFVLGRREIIGQGYMMVKFHIDHTGVPHISL